MVNIQYQLYKDINKLKVNHNDVKTHEGRVQIVKHNPKILKEIAYWSKLVDLKRINQNKYEETNDFDQMLNELAGWITAPKVKGHRKNYKVKFRKDTDIASEIKDSMKTNDRICTGDTNFFKGGGDLKPTKEELKVAHIKSLDKALKYRQRQMKLNIGNRKIISHAIREAHDDLNDALRNYRGINHEGRSDNTVSPKDTLNTPDHYSPDYIKYLLGYSLEELNDRDMRLDKLDVTDAVKALGYDDDPVLNDIEKGFSHNETAKRNNRNQSSVSRHFTTVINKVHAFMN